MIRLFLGGIRMPRKFQRVIVYIMIGTLVLGGILGGAAGLGMF